MTLCSNQGHGSRLKEDPSRYRKGGSNASSPEPEPPKKEAGSKLNFITDQSCDQDEPKLEREVAAYPLSSLQKLVDSVPCKGTPRGPSRPDGNLLQLPKGTVASAPSSDVLKHQHISIVEIPEAHLRVKKIQSSSSSKAEVEELEQFSESEENVLENCTDHALQIDFSHGKSRMTEGFKISFFKDELTYQQCSKVSPTDVSSESTLNLFRDEKTETANQGNSQLGIRLKRRKKNITVVEKASSIVGNRGNDDVDDLVAFINSSTEGEKAICVKKTRKSKSKQSRSHSSEYNNPDSERQDQLKRDRSKTRSSNSKAKILPVSFKDSDRMNNNDVTLTRNEMLKSHMCTVSNSDEKMDGHLDLQDDAKANHAIHPEEENIPQLEIVRGSSPDQNLLSDEQNELPTVQASQADNGKPEVIHVKGNSRSMKQSNPSSEKLNSSHLATNCKNYPTKNQQEAFSKKKSIIEAPKKNHLVQKKELQCVGGSHLDHPDTELQETVVMECHPRNEKVEEENFCHTPPSKNTHCQKEDIHISSCPPNNNPVSVASQRVVRPNHHPQDFYSSPTPNVYPKEFHSPDSRYQAQIFRHRQAFPQHFTPGIKPQEGHKFLPELHLRNRKGSAQLVRFSGPRSVPPAEVQHQLQQQALQEVHHRSLQHHAAQRNHGLCQGVNENRPRTPALTPTKEVDQAQTNSKIFSAKENQFNLKEVVNFLKHEWDLVSQETLSNRPVFFNSN